MAMNGNRLGDAIRAAIDALPDKSDREAVFRALGNEIINEVTTYGEVGTVGSDPQGGVVNSSGTIS